MKKEECYELGYITKSHGLSGEIFAVFDVDDTNHYLELEHVLIETDFGLEPFEVEYLSPHKNGFIIKLEGLEKIEDTAKFLKRTLYLPLDALPDLGPNSYYYHELVGFSIKDEEIGEVGTVASVITETAQPLLVTAYQGDEVIIPLVDDIVLKVDKEVKTVHTQLPEGLIQLNKQEKESE